MKQLLIGVAAFVALHPRASFAQTTEKNVQKYWKFRNEFREKFVKIGRNDGESIAARALRPIICVDNITQYGNAGYGEILWGDGMIRHGYYLGLLATEYRLLKDAGQDVTGVLNELYYATVKQKWSKV